MYGMKKIYDDIEGRWVFAPATDQPRETLTGTTSQAPIDLTRGQQDAPTASTFSNVRPRPQAYFGRLGTCVGYPLQQSNPYGSLISNQRFSSFAARRQQAGQSRQELTHPHVIQQQSLSGTRKRPHPEDVISISSTQTEDKIEPDKHEPDRNERIIEYLSKLEVPEEMSQPPAKKQLTPRHVLGRQEVPQAQSAAVLVRGLNRDSEKPEMNPALGRGLVREATTVQKTNPVLARGLARKPLNAGPNTVLARGLVRQQVTIPVNQDILKDLYKDPTRAPKGLDFRLASLRKTTQQMSETPLGSDLSRALQTPSRLSQGLAIVRPLLSSSCGSGDSFHTAPSPPRPQGTLLQGVPPQTPPLQSAQPQGPPLRGIQPQRSSATGNRTSFHTTQTQSLAAITGPNNCPFAIEDDKDSDLGYLNDMPMISAVEEPQPNVDHSQLQSGFAETGRSGSHAPISRTQSHSGPAYQKPKAPVAETADRSTATGRAEGGYTTTSEPASCKTPDTLFVSDSEDESEGESTGLANKQSLMTSGQYTAETSQVANKSAGALSQKSTLWELLGIPAVGTNEHLTTLALGPTTATVQSPSDSISKPRLSAPASKPGVDARAMQFNAKAGAQRNPAAKASKTGFFFQNDEARERANKRAEHLQEERKKQQEAKEQARITAAIAPKSMLSVPISLKALNQEKSLSVNDDDDDDDDDLRSKSVALTEKLDRCQAVDDDVLEWGRSGQNARQIGTRLKQKYGNSTLFTGKKIQDRFDFLAGTKNGIPLRSHKKATPSRPRPSDDEEENRNFWRSIDREPVEDIDVVTGRRARDVALDKRHDHHVSRATQGGKQPELWKNWNYKRTLNNGSDEEPCKKAEQDSELDDSDDENEPEAGTYNVYTVCRKVFEPDEDPDNEEVKPHTDDAIGDYYDLAQANGVAQMAATNALEEQGSISWDNDKDGMLIWTCWTPKRIVRTSLARSVRFVPAAERPEPSPNLFKRTVYVVREEMTTEVFYDHREGNSDGASNTPPLSAQTSERGIDANSDLFREDLPPSPPPTEKSSTTAGRSEVLSTTTTALVDVGPVHATLDYANKTAAEYVLEKYILTQPPRTKNLDLLTIWRADEMKMVRERREYFDQVGEPYMECLEVEGRTRGLLEAGRRNKELKTVKVWVEKRRFVGPRN